MLYMLIVVSGLNVVEFDTYDTAAECIAMAQDAVSNYSGGEVTAVCLDSHGDKIMEAGRS